MNITKRITWVSTVAIIALTVGLSGCERIARIVAEDQTALPKTLQKEISIDVAVALTGEYAEPYGLPMTGNIACSPDSTRFAVVSSKATETGMIPDRSFQSCLS